MEQKIIDTVVNEIRPVLEGHEFTEKDGVFNNGTTAFCVAYDEERQLFCLNSATVTDGEVGEFSTVGSYLFDSTQSASDAVAVGMDFTDTIATTLGVNTRKLRSASSIALPQKAEGDTADIGALCNKLLAIFPAYKDEYKARIAADGEFLYVQFFLNTFATEIRTLLEGGNGKKIKKVFDSLNDLFVVGDRTVGDTIIVVLLGGAVKGDPTLTEKMLTYLEDFPYLKKQFRFIASRTTKDKRLREMYEI